MASALISAPTTALAQSLLSSNSSVHVNDSFDTATPFVDEVLEVSPVQSGISFGQTLDFIIPHSAPLINDIWLKVKLPAVASGKIYLPKAGLILLKKVKVFVGTQLVHEYEGAYDAIYDELEQDRSVPHTVNLINECWATQVLLRRSQRAQVLHIPLRVLTGYGRKFAVPLYKLRGSGNDLKIQITYASHKDVTATWVTTGLHTDSGLAATTDLDSKLVLRYTHVSPYELSLHPNSVTWAGKYMQSYNVRFTSGTSFRLPFTGVCYEMVIVVRDDAATDKGFNFWKFRPLSKIDLKCDNIKALDSSVHDAHFLRTAIANREHRNVPTRKYLELLQGFADNTDANGAKALAEAPDSSYGANEVSIINALRNALHPHPWSGNDTTVTDLDTQDYNNSDIMPAVQNGAATAASAQYGTEFIYAIPFGTEVADDTKMFGGLDFGAFKTIELTLTTAKTLTTPIADIYCRYYNEISFINGGAYRRFH
eukprot:tig00020936_g16179.t1